MALVEAAIHRCYQNHVAGTAFLEMTGIGNHWNDYDFPHEFDAPCLQEEDPYLIFT